MMHLGRSCREKAADALDWIAVKLWSLADRLRPVYDGPLCPDCRRGPLLPEDEECPTCREDWEHQQTLNEIDRAAYTAGYQAAVEAEREPF